MKPIPVSAFEAREEWSARAPRTVATLLVGKLSHDGNPGQLCRVRNLSETGMQIDAVASFAAGMRVSVELRGGVLLSGEIAWTRGSRAGVQFDEPVDVAAVLGKPRPGSMSGRPRSPRFIAEIPARINSYGRPIDVIVADLSQGGACLRLQRTLRPDTEVILSIPGLPPRRCTARWSDGNFAGVAFHTSFSYLELSTWLDSSYARG